ncbi:MAG: cysteine synthase A [Alphaproteobacteria bacterium GM202ARS2]|nr:cysteine synthase A [Alphaproteobacteria bacterium GM202ARS2]
MQDGFIGAIGNTPLIYLRVPSALCGCDIFGKAEFMNPGGSVKDRAAWGLVRDAERQGVLTAGKDGIIVEGTAGNTGIGLALVGRARGYRTEIVMPKTQSEEKKDFLRLCGARLHLVEAVPYRNPKNYVRYSETLADTIRKTSDVPVLWANQFDNCANRQMHLETTAEEIWTQTSGRVDAFICSVGTGGTLAGVGMGLKKKNPSVRIALADPMGSALYAHYTQGCLCATGSSITEGIGQGRITKNLQDAPIDEAVQVDDTQALNMVYDLAEKEGLILGGSSGVNVAAAVQLGKRLGKGKRIVTILCDSGNRYQSKLFNVDFLREKNLPVPSWLETP